MPEIFSGAVEIMAIAREPGLRSQGRGRRAAGEGRPGRLLRRHSRRAHPEHRQRAQRREDRRDRVVARHGAASSPTPSARRKSVDVTLNEEEKTARVIVPTDQMSLAIGKEGQNARLAYKLTGWRIDIKDPESLHGRTATCCGRRGAGRWPMRTADDFVWQGRQPRLVRADGTDHRCATSEFGPLRSRPGRHERRCRVSAGRALNVYYNRDLRRALTTSRTSVAAARIEDALQLSAVE